MQNAKVKMEMQNAKILNFILVVLSNSEARTTVSPALVIVLCNSAICWEIRKVSQGAAMLRRVVE